METVVQLFLNILLVGLFFFSKLMPHKDKIDPKYLGIYNFFQGIFLPLFRFLKPVSKTVVVGRNLSVDMTQVVLFVILLTLLNLSN